MAKTFWLTYTPGDKHGFSNYTQAVTDTKLGRLHPDNWSVNNSKKPRAGDRVFVLRQGDRAEGHPPPGVVGRGKITRGSYDSTKNRDGTGPHRMRVDVVFDLVLGPEEDPVPNPCIGEGAYRGPRASGNKIPEEIAASIEAEWSRRFAHRRLTGTSKTVDEELEITRGELAGLVERLQGLETTDTEQVVLARKEQAYWRRLLFGGSQMQQCAACGSTLSVKLLVVAHIKARHRCSLEERLDPHNVMPLCLLGCDALFEHGFITVGTDGHIQPNETMTGVVQERLAALRSRRISCWSAERRPYFKDHAAACKRPVATMKSLNGDQLRS